MSQKQTGLIAFPWEFPRVNFLRFCRRRRSQGRSSENLFLSTERKPALINKMGRRKIVIKQIEDEKLRRVSENISYIYMKRTVIDICL